MSTSEKDPARESSRDSQATVPDAVPGEPSAATEIAGQQYHEPSPSVADTEFDSDVDTEFDGSASTERDAVVNTDIDTTFDSDTEVRAEKATRLDVPTELSAHPVGRARQKGGPQVVRERFVLEQRLGRGGMGQVFKARDLRKVEAEDDNPYVAIKFLGEEFSKHPKALISLQREAKKSQQLAHPNILTVYDFDRDGDRVYMTMEYLQGEPISSWEKIKFPEGKKPAIASMIEQMARGLAYAHNQGVVHSDFKPDNVFVTIDGRVKILDFGIARIMDTALNTDSFDAAELGALTTRYASLEMLRGLTEPHPADDVYALGLVAYEMFAGTHPFDGKSATEALLEDCEPAPIKGLKRHQWQAISHALELKRSRRTASVDLFLRQFSGVKTRNRYLLAAVLVLALSSGYFAYKASLPEGPAVPFGQLPLVTQQQFLHNIERGQLSTQVQDWDGALRYYLAAYDLHPRNIEAEQGLDSLAKNLVIAAAQLDSARQRQYLLTLIQGYSDNEYLAGHKELSALRLELEQEFSQ